MSELTSEQLDAIEARVREYVTEGYSWETVGDYGVTADDVLALVDAVLRAREYMRVADQTIFDAGVALGEAFTEMAQLRQQVALAQRTLAAFRLTADEEPGSVAGDVSERGAEPGA